VSAKKFCLWRSILKAINAAFTFNGFAAFTFNGFDDQERKQDRGQRIKQGRKIAPLSLPLLYQYHV